MAFQFSDDGRYFAQITNGDNLKIWNTLTNSLEQQFAFNIQLTASCTCLLFISSDFTNTPGSPRKKKKKELGDSHVCSIVLGTSSGGLLVYSLKKADIDYSINHTTSECVNCLSSNLEEFVFSGSDSSIVVWNLHRRNISSAWVTGNEKITAILAIPDSDTLLAASKCIKLWKISSREVLKMFTGHASQVTLLDYIKTKTQLTDAYFISGSKGDRLLCCWKLNGDINEKCPVTNFLMEDIVSCVSTYCGHDGTLSFAATVRSGVVHIYQHTLNGKKSYKPLKPKTSIQIVSGSLQDEVVCPVYITAATHRNFNTLCMCYGSAVVQIFEDITLSSYKKLQCLLRENINRKNVTEESNTSKFYTPSIEKDVHYSRAQVNRITMKRKNDGPQEVPMEKRLENLIVNEVDNYCNKVLKTNTVAHLLMQGLHSKDKNILNTVFIRKDEQLIKATVQRIPLSLIPSLMEELTNLMHGKTHIRHTALTWLRNLLMYSGSFLSSQDLFNIFDEVLRNIECILALQPLRSKLVGRLELLVAQINQTPQDSQNVEVPVIFSDKVFSGVNNIDTEVEFHSNSDIEWDEDTAEVDNMEEMNEISDGTVRESD